MNTVLWLYDISQNEIDFVGGKAAHLGELLQLNYNIPPAFCIPSYVYTDSVFGNKNISQFIKQAIELIDFNSGDSLREQSTLICQKIQEIKLDQIIVSDILDAYKRLKIISKTSQVSVRSSSNIEDVRETSSAGQFNTYLNVFKNDSLLTHIIKCWASFWSESAIKYRADHSISHFKSGIAVIIQQMIFSQIGGVMFTCDPITNEDNIVIESNWGLGEAIVSGQATPDIYVINKHMDIEIRTSIASKDFMITPIPNDEGTEMRVPPKSAQKKRTLTYDQIKQLTYLGVEIEKYYQFPQDIEWAIKDDKIFILQSRPITTLQQKAAVNFFTESFPQDTTLWTSGFFNERFPNPVSPLGWSLIKELIELFAIKEPLSYIGYHNSDNIKLTRVFLGHPYVNVQVFQMLYKFFPKCLLPEDAYRFFPDGDTDLRFKVPLPKILHFLISIPRVILQDHYWHLFNFVAWEKFINKYDLYIENIISDVDSIDSLDQLIIRIDDLLIWGGELLRIHRWSLTYAESAYKLLGKFIQYITKRENSLEIRANLVGSLSNKTKEIDQAIWLLAEKARDLNDIDSIWLYLLREEEGNDKLHENIDFFIGIDLKQKFDQFIKKYGHRSVSMDIYYSPYSADKTQIIQLIEDVAKSKEYKNPYYLEAVQKKKREEAIQAIKYDLSNSIFDKIFPIKWLITMCGIQLTQIYMKLREDQRFYLQKCLSALRKTYLIIGNIFVKDGIIISCEDIFFLTCDEINAIIKKEMYKNDIPHLCFTRKQEFERLHKMGYSRFLQGDNPIIESKKNSKFENVLQGIPVSPGLAYGNAKIILPPYKIERIYQQVKPGDILIVMSTDPAWTPLFTKINGLVMSIGGQLSHGAVMAREYGIPAVVGIGDAIYQIKDGADIFIDGNQGTVKIIKSIDN